MAGPVARPNEDRPMFGIGLMILAFFVFSCIDVSAKWLAVAGLSFLQLSFMRYLGHFVISIVLILKDGISFSRFESARLPLVFLRGVLLMLSTITNFLALRYLPLTLTATILFSVPIFICALSPVLLSERVGFWRWSAIIAGFIGILIAIRPFSESFHWAVFISLSGALCFALYSILTRKLSGTVAVESMQLYAGMVGTIVLLPFAITHWRAPDNSLDWIIMIFLGVFGWLGHQILTRAHAFAPASLLTPFSYTFIIYLTIWSYLVFDHLPDRWTIAGAVVVIAAGLMIWFRESRLNRQKLARGI